ncbi:hypothetical protein F0L68_28920 [Solihabitans fulvus]|uniref:Uncharacterized protein n=1 Tax=Solihabitans fulvus TaxID=1892852 RepID=A0A5B2WWD7_9PSEU|nr:hypothetical protein [Solihabitans fulvus]KAA2255244.1 hypothetical protein F0L68_28920 [Solihabitans fulvus]
MPGLSIQAQRQILEFECQRRTPGDIANAVRSWSWLVHRPGAPPLARSYGTFVGCEECDCYGHDCMDSRSLLELALRALPPGAARELRRVVAPLDEVYLRRVLPNPVVGECLDWWRFQR